MFWYLLLNFQVFLLIDGWRRTFHFIYFKMDIHSVWMNVKCEHSLYSVHWVCNCYWKFRPISISYYLVFIRFNMDVHYSFGSFMPNFQLATISCRIWCLKAKIPGVLNLKKNYTYTEMFICISVYGRPTFFRIYGELMFIIKFDFLLSRALMKLIFIVFPVSLDEHFLQLLLCVDCFPLHLIGLYRSTSLLCLVRQYSNSNITFCCSLVWW